MLSQTGKVINKRPVRGLPLQTSRRHRQGGEHLRLAGLHGRDDRGGGEQVREGGGEVQAGGPSDGAHAEDPQVPQAAAEAGGPDLCLARGVPQHRAGILHNQR